VGRNRHDLREMLKRRGPPGRKKVQNPNVLRGTGKESVMGTRRWKKLLPTATLTAVSFTVAGQSAYALFPPVWPVSPPPSVISPPVAPPPVVVVPPVTPPPVVVPPVVPPPVIVPPVVPPSQCVPEPSSLVAGIAGLASAAGWAMRRRKKNPAAGQG
jgi:hypothetical protein